MVGCTVVSTMNPSREQMRASSLRSESSNKTWSASNAQRRRDRMRRCAVEASLCNRRPQTQRRRHQASRAPSRASRSKNRSRSPRRRRSRVEPHGDPCHRRCRWIALPITAIFCNRSDSYRTQKRKGETDNRSPPITIAKNDYRAAAAGGAKRKFTMPKGGSPFRRESGSHTRWRARHRHLRCRGLSV